MSIADKLHLKDPTAIRTIGAPSDVGLTEGAGSDPEVVVLFVRGRAEALERLPELLAGDPEHPARWIAYEKRRGAGMSRAVVWEVSGSLGWRPVSQIAVSDNWSAMRLRRVDAVHRRPKP